MNGKLGRIAAALLFTSAAIICSFPVWAAPGNNQPDGNAILGQCIGIPGAQIAYPFSEHYSCASLGPVPGLPTSYGGLTFKYDDPNTVLIGGGANDASGRIYQVAVTRDANRHITGFSGIATPYPRTTSRIGQYNDGGVAFGPDNVLFVTHYPDNKLEQSKPGSNIVNKLTDLAPFGVTSSVGALAFVPQGFPGAGSMKLVSYPGGDWYSVDYSPDGSGTFNIHSAVLRTNIGGAEGIAFVPPGSPAFTSNSSALVAKYLNNMVIAAPLDANGDPIVANSQSFITGIVGPEGAAIDPVTGDFLVSTSGTGDKVVRVSGFAVPSPGPIPTPVDCNFRVGIVFVNPSGNLPAAIRDEISADPDVASVDLLSAVVLTPALEQLRQYDIVVVINNAGFGNSATLGDNLADYVEGGGVVIECPYGFFGPDSPVGLSGRWLTGNYSPYNYSKIERTGEFEGAIDDPVHRHPLMAGVTTLQFSYMLAASLPPGTTKVASVATTGEALVAYRPRSGGHGTVGITAYLGNDSHSGDWGRVIVNAARWLHPCRIPTPAPTPTPTATPTATPIATATATPTATPITTPTATATPIATATATPTTTPTATPTATAMPSATSAPTATPMLNSHLANISTRMRVEAGDNVLIAGFIVQGSDNKRLIIRGIGPSLAGFGVGDALQDPTLQLLSGATELAANDDWDNNPNVGEIDATGLAPRNAQESALLITLAPGSYTAALRGKGGSTGVGLVEVYDLDANGPAKVVNISTRGFILTGENVMIGGLIITGNDPAQLVIRAIGPSLGTFGIPNPLSDPFLELHDGNGALIQANNNWSDTQELALQNTGLAPGNNLESAMLISVAPGNYSAVVKGADGGTGNGLVEVYKLSP